MSEQIPEYIGRYKVTQLLGKGAMGIVYKAVDPVIDREVAIKTIKVSLAEEELALYEARFAQEIKTVGKLNHPHIVPIYDVGRTEQFAYMAMEFIDGQELKAYMMGACPSTWPRRWTWSRRSPTASPSRTRARSCTAT